MNNVLLLTDFSELSEYARSLADKVAYYSGAKLHILKIVDVPSGIQISNSGELLDSMGSDLSSLQEEKLKSEEMISAWTSELKANHESYVTYGQLHHIISTKIKELNIELLVMGTHGVSGMKELLSGSITEHVILKNTVPVLSLKCNRDNLDFSDFLVTGDFEENGVANFDILKALQQVFNSTFHLLWINTKSRFITSSVAMERMKKFAQKNQFQNTQFHIYNDNSIEEGIINFANNYDASHELDIDIIAVEKKEKSQLGYILTGCQATSFVNHIFRPIITYLNK